MTLLPHETINIELGSDAITRVVMASRICHQLEQLQAKESPLQKGEVLRVNATLSNVYTLVSSITCTLAREPLISFAEIDAALRPLKIFTERKLFQPANIRPRWFNIFKFIRQKRSEIFQEIEEWPIPLLVGEIFNPIKEIQAIYQNSSAKWEEIECFLKKYPFLVSVLIEAKQKISSIFGETSKTILELNKDPEEDFEEIFIVIKSSFDSEKARELMDKLDEEWFLKRIDETKGKLNITEEYDE